MLLFFFTASSQSPQCSHAPRIFVRNFEDSAQGSRASGLSHRASRPHPSMCRYLPGGFHRSQSQDLRSPSQPNTHAFQNQLMSPFNFRSVLLCDIASWCCFRDLLCVLLAPTQLTPHTPNKPPTVAEQRHRSPIAQSTHNLATLSRAQTWSFIC